ncbi:hypothetical protein [Microvirga calopogonii]|uniref:hypothetical protein n=1 Tax=Microvirga calopogonii TaxID=2078013 RepID=UPI0013B4493B|nr:hypothetical protein [Microvirga calopogonii]
MTYTRRNPEIKKPRRMRVTVPEHAGPHVRLVFAEMARQGVNYWELEGRSGIQKATIKAWRYKNVPSLTSLESCLNALGWDLIPLPKDRVIDASILEELQPIADRLGLTLGDAVQFATEIAVGLHSKPNMPT